MNAKEKIVAKIAEYDKRIAIRQNNSCYHDETEAVKSFNDRAHGLEEALVILSECETDKDGKEIYEGDILDCADRTVRVKWNHQNGCWDCDFVAYINTLLVSSGITPVEWKFRAMIVGNIHDNPELSEVG